MIQVILCKVGGPPQVTSISPDDAGDYSTALEELLGIPIACIPVPGGIELFCGRDCLLYGLLLVRRALAMSLAKPWQSEIALVFDRSDPGFGLDGWSVSGDFLLARATDDGELVDLTESDVTLFMSWLRLVYIQLQHRWCT